MARRAISLALTVWLTACGGGAGPGDASGADGAVPCTADLDCDDVVFCNGAERCEGGRCVAGAAPCAGSSCDEASQTCASCETPDADGDGHDAIACGGDDCDDEDADRYPGNAEVCDGSHDEDCDDTTLGSDRDRDGYAPTECCNGARCGADCDDERPSVNPDAVDSCGGDDEDCDGSVDEADPPGTFYRDRDGDNYGDGSDSVTGCTQPAGYVDRADDCNDDPTGDDPSMGIFASQQNPGQLEVCGNAIDDDCDESVDENVVTCWRDADEDGFPSGAATERCACDEGWTASDPSDVGVDCYDRDEDVHPEQDAYFTEGYCPSGCRCSDGRCHTQAFRCATIGGCATGDSDESFDYDCNGVDTPPPPATAPFSCGLSCCGRYVVPPAPPCGEVGQIVDCGTGLCGACSGGTGTSTEVIGCR